MSSCEKCWVDAGMVGIPYHDLVQMRVASPCTAEQQAGPDAGECPRCKRKTLHQMTAEPMCGCASIFQKPTAEAVEAIQRVIDEE
jgi:hypothetical protein